MRRTLALIVAFSAACSDPDEGSDGADAGGTTESSSTGTTAASASTSSTTDPSTTDAPPTSSESGEPSTTTMAAESSSSGEPTEVECEWFDQPGRDRSWGLCSPAMAWQDAEDHCVSEGGHLVSIASAQDGVFAINVLTGVEEAWIGLNDIARADTYEWTDGTPYEHMNWDSDTGQPDDPDHRCVAIGVSRRWFDYDCDNNRVFLCARPL